MSITKTGIAQQFWAEFVLNNWERECLSIKGSFIHPPTTSDELLSMIVEKWNVDEQLYKRSRFYIQGKLQKLDKSDPLWPNKEDKSFIDYDKRILSTINGQEYVLVIDGFQINDSLWDWTYDFLQNLYKSLGYLSHSHFYSIFYGNYNVTPFGVHYHFTPEQSAFYFPITGRKSMRTWTSEFADKHPNLKGTKDFQNFLEGSTLLEAETGGMLYWPSDRWHVGDSKGGDVSIVLAINASNDFVMPLTAFIAQEIQVLYKNSLKRHLLEQIIRALAFWHLLYQAVHFWSKNSSKEYLKNPINRVGIKLLALVLSIIPSREIRTKAVFNPDDLQGSAEQIPESIRIAAARFERTVNSSIIERASTKLWLTALTSFGFSPVLEPHPISSEHGMLTLDSYIRVFPKRIILWRKVNDNEIIVAVNGLCISVSLHPVFINLIKNINSQKMQKVEVFIKMSMQSIDKNYIIEYSFEEVLKFLETLLRYRGIQIVK